MTSLEPLELSRALRPLYGARANPDELVRRAADAVSAFLGGPVRLVLPEPLQVQPSGAEAGEMAWSVDFQHDGASGRVSGSHPVPDAAVQAALRVEMERFCAYLAVLRVVASVFDRLEFRLHALHQIARTLSVVREVGETEAHIVDFTGELFFAWWTALYRPRGDGRFEARRVRALRGASAPSPILGSDLAAFVAVGAESGAVPVKDAPTWLPEEARALAPLDVGGERLGCLLLGDRMNEEPYREEDIQLLATLAHSSAVALRNAELLEQLREQALVDELTGLYNRRYFDAEFALEIDRARRYRRPFSLLLVDVDRFKAYNDEFGHTAGDLVLARIGALLRADIRKVDTACRYGGEEFIVIAPETTAAQACALADRLHRAAGGMEPVAGLRRPITVSIGVASCPEHAEDSATLLEAADRALYRAKAEGRNRVVSA